MKKEWWPVFTWIPAFAGMVNKFRMGLIKKERGIPPAPFLFYLLNTNFYILLENPWKSAVMRFCQFFSSGNDAVDTGSSLSGQEYSCIDHGCGRGMP